MGAILTKICAYFVAFLIWLIGGFDTLAKVLIGLMLIDYASGVYAGYKLKNLNLEIRVLLHQYWHMYQQA